MKIRNILYSRPYMIMVGIQFLMTLYFLYFPVLYNPFSKTILIAFSLFHVTSQETTILLKELSFLFFRIPLILFGAGYLQSKYSSAEGIILTRQTSLRTYYLRNLFDLFMLSLINFIAILAALGIFLLPDLLHGFSPLDLLWLRQMSPLLILYPMSGFVLLLYINTFTIFTSKKYNVLIGLSLFLINMMLFKIPSSFVQSWVQYSPMAAQSFNYIGKQVPTELLISNLGIDLECKGNAFILFVSLAAQILVLSFITSKSIKYRDCL